MRTLQGYLRRKQELSDLYTSTYSYDFECIDGTFIEDVSFDQGIEIPPINVCIEARIIGTRIFNWDFVKGPSESRSDEVKDIALIRVIDEQDLGGKTYEQIKKRYEDGIKKEADELQHFLRRTNQGKWTVVKVTPYIVFNTTNTPRGLHFRFNGEGIVEQMREQNPEGYDKHTYFHGRGGSKTGINGHAYENSNKAWTYSGGIRTVEHEQGHCFGCPHSTTEGNPYGAPDCVMAKAYAGFSAPQYSNMLQFTDRSFLTTEDDGCYFIVPVEVHDSDLRKDEFRAIRLVTSSASYCISTRKSEEQSFIGASSMWWDDNAIFIHKVNKFGDRFGEPVYLGALNKGDSMTLDGKTVSYSQCVDSTIRVLIGDVAPTDFPQAQEPMPANDITKDFEGVWYNENYAAQGIDFWIIPEKKKIVGYWFTYHPQGEHAIDLHNNNNGREWFILDGDIRDGYADVDIIETNDKGEDKIIGHGLLRFSENLCTFRSYTTRFGRDNWVMNKLTSVRQPFKHTGIFETGQFQGYTISKYTYKDNEGKEKEKIVAYRYGYNRGQNTWSVFEGTDLKDMSKMIITSSYKNSKASVDNKGSVDLLPITENTQIL